MAKLAAALQAYQQCDSGDHTKIKDTYFIYKARAYLTLVQIIQMN